MEEAIIKLWVPMWYLPKAVRYLSHQVASGNLHKVSMWDFVQIPVVATRVQGLGYVVDLTTTFGMQLPHQRKVSSIAEIMMMSSVFRDS
ncbi:unnamed protein product [Prunus armeniaca]